MRTRRHGSTEQDRGGAANGVTVLVAAAGEPRRERGGMPRGVSGPPLSVGTLHRLVTKMEGWFNQRASVVEQIPLVEQPEEGELTTKSFQEKARAERLEELQEEAKNALMFLTTKSTETTMKELVDHKTKIVALRLQAFAVAAPSLEFVQDIEERGAGRRRAQLRRRVAHAGRRDGRPRPRGPARARAPQNFRRTTPREADPRPDAGASCEWPVPRATSSECIATNLQTARGPY